MGCPQRSLTASTLVHHIYRTTVYGQENDKPWFGEPNTQPPGSRHVPRSLWMAAQAANSWMEHTFDRTHVREATEREHGRNWSRLSHPRPGSCETNYLPHLPLAMLAAQLHNSRARVCNEYDLASQRAASCTTGDQECPVLRHCLLHFHQHIRWRTSRHHFDLKPKSFRLCLQQKRKARQQSTPSTPGIHHLSWQPQQNNQTNNTLV